MWISRLLQGSLFLSAVALGAGLLLGCQQENSEPAPPVAPEGGVLPPLSPACKRDSECTSGHCDPLHGCVECVFDRHCASGQGCHEGKCEVEPPCKLSSDCAKNASTPVCDFETKHCVRCVIDKDCGKNAHCTDQACVPFIPCINSLDCPKEGASVCDRSHGECVGCLVDGDCAKDHTCVDHQCAAKCKSDNECKEAGQLCDLAGGICVQCVQQNDCPAIYHCSRGQCARDTCESGRAQCDPLLKTILTCNAAGDGNDVTPCGSNQTCVAKDGKAVCKSWLCQPNQATCDDKARFLHVCSADGLSILPNPTDCAAKGQVCSGGKCQVKQCEPGKPFCKDGAIQTCVDGVVSEIKQACGSGTYCNPATTACEPVKCGPGATVCDADMIKKCNADGSGYDDSAATDCAKDGKACYAGTCQPRLCTGDHVCQGNASYDCTNNGTSTSRAQICSSYYQYCDAASGLCQTQKCSPGSPSCDGNLAGKCDDLGSGLLPGATDCTTAGQVCYGGSCSAKICTDGAQYCKNGSIYRCGSAGSAESLYKTCSILEYCDSTVDPPLCQTRKCVPGGPACNGGVAATCNADGSGFETGGTDCSAAGQVCYGGACAPKICTDGTQYCKSGNIYRCGSAGSAESLYKTCFVGQYCDGTTSPPTCQARKCTPAAKLCNGTIATTCNADGSGFESGGTDCSTDGKGCVNGACLPIICKANEYFCSSGNVYQCGPTGATSSLYSTCSSSYYCQDGTSYCLYDVCTAGAAMCNGDVLTTCKPDGSGPTSGGTDCTLSSKVCDGASCQSVVCTANTRFCSGGNVRLCNAKGTNSSPYATCLVSEFCDGTAATAACRQDICTANAAACNGESTAVCNADGSGYASTITDCSLSGKVCDLASGCLTSAVDTVGSNTSTYSSGTQAYGTYFAALTSRKLTQIEGYFSVSGTSIFTWVVYESATQNGTYSKVVEQTTSSSGTGKFHTSDALSVPLTKGKYYLIGVIVSGSHSYFYSSGSSTKPVSFGQAIGSYASAYVTSPPATLTFSSGTTGYYQRFTTTSP